MKTNTGKSIAICLVFYVNFDLVICFVCFWTNNTSITKQTKQVEALLRLTVMNKHKVSQNLEKFFHFVQSIVDIGYLFHCFIFIWKKEWYLNVGWFVQIVLLDCDTQLPDIACCYSIYSIRDVELLIHSWFFARFGFIFRYESNLFSIVINGITDCR